MNIDDILTQFKTKLSDAVEAEKLALEAYEKESPENAKDHAIKFMLYARASGYTKGLLEATDIIMKSLRVLES